jgi:hypothetical protein
MASGAERSAIESTETLCKSVRKLRDAAVLAGTVSRLEAVHAQPHPQLKLGAAAATRWRRIHHSYRRRRCGIPDATWGRCLRREQASLARRAPQRDHRAELPAGARRARVHRPGSCRRRRLPAGLAGGVVTAERRADRRRTHRHSADAQPSHRPCRRSVRPRGWQRRHHPRARRRAGGQPGQTAGRTKTAISGISGRRRRPMPACLAGRDCCGAAFDGEQVGPDVTRRGGPAPTRRRRRRPARGRAVRVW